MFLKNTLYKIVEVYHRIYGQYYCAKKRKNFNLYKIDNVDILYLTIAFNNAESIKLQYIGLKKFSEDRWGYMVVDNSTNREISGMIEKWCIEEEIAYTKLPENRLKLSDSHACALNWTCRNILSNVIGVNIIGFIDHDIFPIKPIKITNIMNSQNVYGFKREADAGKWYLWPGLFFCKLKDINIKSFDFFPINGMDTRGGYGICFLESRLQKVMNLQF